MNKYKIPTAGYQAFSSYDDAEQYLKNLNADANRVVIKVDGLAAGKGVILPESQTEALQALREILIGSKFGQAGRSVVIEEFLEGDEFSVLTFSDGKTFKSLPPGQDHKRIWDGNRGPNTGGMGVYAPLPFVGQDQMKEIDRDIIQPTLDGLKAEGIYLYIFTNPFFSSGVVLTFIIQDVHSHAFHRHNDDQKRTRGPRIQREIWRSRNPNDDDAHGAGM